MSRPCATCIHPDKEAIDKALLAGQPYRSVARQYEASPPSVYRHQQDHLPAAMSKAVEAAGVAHGGTLLQQIADQVNELKQSGIQHCILLYHAVDSYQEMVEQTQWFAEDVMKNFA